MLESFHRLPIHSGDHRSGWPLTIAELNLNPKAALSPQNLLQVKHPWNPSQYWAKPRFEAPELSLKYKYKELDVFL